MKAPRTEPRRAVVLLAVLVVVVLLSLAAYQFSDLMSAELHAADSHARLLQAQAAARSGAHYAAALLSNPDEFSALNGNPFDNPTYFQDFSINDDENLKRKMLFSLLAVRDADDPEAASQVYRYGVIDEAGRINLNALLQVDSSGNTGQQILMALPNMTEDIA
ncbi:MAG: hypothetical protein ACRD36_13540, partial [Candidatus Acidiferrum sp.]